MASPEETITTHSLDWQWVIIIIPIRSIVPIHYFHSPLIALSAADVEGSSAFFKPRHVMFELLFYGYAAVVFRPIKVLASFSKPVRQ